MRSDADHDAVHTRRRTPFERMESIVGHPGVMIGLTATIAALDWIAGPHVSLGLLYLVPLTLAASGEKRVDIQWIGRHVQLAIRARTPFDPRAVRIHLDAQAIGIGQIDRFADGMIGETRHGASTEHMSQESAKSGSVG